MRVSQVLHATCRLGSNMGWEGRSILRLQLRAAGRLLVAASLAVENVRVLEADLGTHTLEARPTCPAVWRVARAQFLSSRTNGAAGCPTNQRPTLQRSPHAVAICPAGKGGPSCEVCDRGFYAPAGTAARPYYTCTACPTAKSTVGPGSTASANCTGVPRL